MTNPFALQNSPFSVTANIYNGDNNVIASFADEDGGILQTFTRPVELVRVLLIQVRRIDAAGRKLGIGEAPYGYIGPVASKLNQVYAPANASFDVDAHPVPINISYKVDARNVPARPWPREMQDVGDTIDPTHEYDFYVLLLPKVKTSWMGGVTTAGIAEDFGEDTLVIVNYSNVPRTVAHEIGHLLTLRHPWDAIIKYEKAPRPASMLMDYVGGEQLRHYEWKTVHEKLKKRRP